MAVGTQALLSLTDMISSSFLLYLSVQERFLIPGIGHPWLGFIHLGIMRQPIKKEKPFCPIQRKFISCDINKLNCGSKNPDFQHKKPLFFRNFLAQGSQVSTSLAKIKEEPKYGS